MNNEKTITLQFDLGQICNDVLVNCNLISQTIKDLADEDIKANVQQPDNPETRSLICRAVTEAFGKAKVAAQRYLQKGRTYDNNNLERLVDPSQTTYAQVEVQDTNASGYLLYNATVSSSPAVVYKVGDSWFDNTTNTAVTVTGDPTPKMVTVNGDPITIVYETVVLTLVIPNFNTSVTDHLKSMIHKYVVDWTMYRFLTDQVADKAAEYKKVAEDEDYVNIVSDLNARERYTMRKPSFM